MDEQKIKYFLTVAHTLNFTAAAKLLFVSQQAVTKQISSLEEELGMKLFERDTHKVTLTAAGKIAKTEFEKINESIAMALQKMRDNSFTATITIGFFMDFPKDRIVFPIMKLLDDRFPNVNFSVHQYSFESLREKLLSSEIDFCVTLCWERAFWDNTEAVVLKRIPSVLFVGANHPWAQKKELTAMDISNGTMLSLRSNASLSHNTFFDRLKAGKYIYMSNFTSILTNVELGKGFAMASRFFEGYDSGKYVLFPFPGDEDTSSELIFAYNTKNTNPYLPLITNVVREYVNTILMQF